MHTLYFSYTPASPIEPNAWLEQATQFINEMHCANSVQLELPVARAGNQGLLPDNPSIDLIDRLQQDAYAKNHPITALHLPLHFPAEEHLGAEISAVNGWTDMACYMGINMIRLKLPGKSGLSSTEHNILFEMIDYILEMEIHAAISCSEPAPSALESYFLEREPDQTIHIGWNISLQWPDDQENLNQLNNQHPVTAVSIKTASSFRDIPLTTIADQIEYQFSDFPPRIFLDFTGNQE